MNEIIVKYLRNISFNCTQHKSEIAVFFNPKTGDRFCKCCVKESKNNHITLSEQQWETYQTAEKFKTQRGYLSKVARHLKVTPTRAKEMIDRLRDKGVDIRYQPQRIEVENSKGEIVYLSFFQNQVLELANSPLALIKDRYTNDISQELGVPLSSISHAIKKLRNKGMYIPSKVERRQNRLAYILAQINEQIKEKKIPRYALIEKVSSEINCCIRLTDRLFKKVEKDNNIFAWKPKASTREKILTLLSSKSKISNKEVKYSIPDLSYRTIRQSIDTLHRLGQVNKHQEGDLIWISRRVS